MVIVSALLAVALVTIVHLLMRSHRQAEQAWESERRELLNRIQRPEVIPTRDVEAFEAPEVEEDFAPLVGTIDYSENGSEGEQ